MAPDPWKDRREKRIGNKLIQTHYHSGKEILTTFPTQCPRLYIEQHSFMLTEVQQEDKSANVVFLILEG